MNLSYSRQAEEFYRNLGFTLHAEFIRATRKKLKKLKKARKKTLTR